MSHYTVSYADLEPEAKQAKALADIKDYVGEVRFESITKLFLEQPMVTLEQFHLMVSFAGVQGYPAQVWFNEIETRRAAL